MHIHIDIDTETHIHTHTYTHHLGGLLNKQESHLGFSEKLVYLVKDSASFILLL